MAKILHHQLPMVLNKSQDDIDAIIKRLKQSQLGTADVKFFEGCVELATWLPQALQEKTISIRQLQNLMFGKNTSRKKKRKKSKSGKSKNNEASADESASDNIPDAEQTQESSSDKNCKITVDQTQTNTVAKGHGRLAHTAYIDSTDHEIKNNELSAGDSCPTRCGGRLYQLKPGIIVRIAGSHLAKVNKYFIEKLRCALCQMIFRADLTTDIPAEKYDERIKALLAIQKYYLGMPFHRLARYQQYVGVPLSASTQFKLVEEVADCVYPVFYALEKNAAQGKLIHNDDTHVKIIEVMKDNELNPEKKRTGMFTSCILSQLDDHKIVLYYSGVKHAGENLASVLKHRATDKEPIIQMCDALSANSPKDINTILCNCLSHAFRKFHDLIDYYPEPCSHVVKIIGQIYQHDDIAQSLTDEQRLYYHRRYSKPLLTQLHRWLKSQLHHRLVEPNSNLGRAIKYFLRHWYKLTQFIRVRSAPIDNNIVERSLKIPIRVRKAALFYKTEHGATIASILTSLIETCIQSNENPVDYLVALQQNKVRVFKEPNAFLPWCYQDTLKQSAFSQAA